MSPKKFLEMYLLTETDDNILRIINSFQFAWNIYETHVIFDNAIVRANI